MDLDLDINLNIIDPISMILTTFYVYNIYKYNI